MLKVKLCAWNIPLRGILRQITQSGMTNINSLLNAFNVKSDSFICMNLNGRIRTSVAKFEFIVLVWHFDEDKLIAFEFAFGTRTINTKLTFVSESLAVVTQSENVGNKGKLRNILQLKTRAPSQGTVTKS